LRYVECNVNNNNNNNKRRGSVVKALVSDWQTFPDMCLIYGWRVTTSYVRRPLWVNQQGQLSLLPSVGWEWVVYR